MEHLIGKLLHDFEHGRMDRRQFIAAVAAAAAVPGVAQGKGFRAVDVNHISYEVADYKKTRDFYADLLGMKVSHDDGTQCLLTFGNTILIPRNPHGRNHPPVIDHVAYTIESWDKKKVEAELRRRRLEPTPDGEDSFHVKDPDGFDLQIIGRT
jgi:catechol 2,3-dioxygenase-like lactoylglutathione lyase family enzyme